MDDKELLELAARAAGMNVTWEGEAVLPGGASIRWNPLTHDGDALRLAVKLGINVNFGNQDEGAVIAFDFSGRFGDCEETGDPMTATRRAIVRAAAALALQESSHE